MPIHDWTRVDAGIFHAFHLEWISALTHMLNDALLPDEYYALQEQSATRLGPDVLTLRRADDEAQTADNNAADKQDAEDDVSAEPAPARAATALCAPRLRPTAQTDLAYYRKKQNAVVVRHTSGDDVVAVIEIASRGNKSTANALRAFVEKAARLLDGGIHLLILDLQPPGRRDPSGIHGAIWEEIDGSEYVAPTEKPLTLVSYEAAAMVQAYVANVAIGDTPPAMPLFLEEGKAVDVPLEATYRTAFAGIAARWRRVLEAPRP